MLDFGGSSLLRTGAAILAVMAVAGLGAPWIAPYDPNEQPDFAQNRPPLSRAVAIQWKHGGWLLADEVEASEIGLRIWSLGRPRELGWNDLRDAESGGRREPRFFLMGTDKYGRDVFSRWLYGARLSLFVASLGLLLAMTVGVTVGALSALGGRILDSLLMRGVDGLVSFPWLFLIIALTALFNSGTWSLILLVGLTGWMGVARLTRAELLSLKERDFVTAARGLGGSGTYIFFRHLLPNAMAPILVDGALRIGQIILVEASLSFLGFGIQPPDPSWGSMINEGRDGMFAAWWVATFPALSLILTVLSFSLVSDGLRDVLDPRKVPAVPDP